jgi:hypothetical protein
VANRLAISGDARGVVIAGSKAEGIATEKVSDLSPGSKPPGANPYEGLLYFEEADGIRFFGREKVTGALYARLTALLEIDTDRPRILPVLGPSGCGKSSLVRAGLVPRLARERAARLVEPRVLVLTPGSHPLEALARALARLTTRHAAPLAETDEFLGILSNTNRTDGCAGSSTLSPAWNPHG